MTDQTPETTDPQAIQDHPDTEGEKLPPPGSEGSVTSQMDEEPDHGEDSYVGHGRLDGQVALVTGTGQGLGQGMALALAEAGAEVLQVVGQHRRNEVRRILSAMDTTDARTVVDALRRFNAAAHELADEDWVLAGVAGAPPSDG